MHHLGGGGYAVSGWRDLTLFARLVDRDPKPMRLREKVDVIFAHHQLEEEWDDSCLSTRNSVAVVE